ncbi:TVP38/TMEM64 family protein [Thermophilibacter sp. ZX-H3]|uniref:TVP38/TMEM64 family protein n=1 Tax=unclassified Thermophilibacter TaxID=2847308 RepID=UPI004040B849
MGEKNRHDVADRDLRARRALDICALVAVGVALAAICLRWAPEAYAWASDPVAVRSFVAEHAILSRLVIGGVNALQIALAFLPGEPVELASGYAFGFLEGTLVCMAASAVASSAIFWAVRRWGWSLVGVFFDRSHLDRFSWLHDARRLELVMLVVFLIPGTPKDFLTYFAGLTDMRFGAVLAITTLGRIPSIVTSTVAASAFGSGDYGIAAMAVVVAVALAAAGGLLYRRFEALARP